MLKINLSSYSLFLTHILTSFSKLCFCKRRGRGGRGEGKKEEGEEKAVERECEREEEKRGRKRRGGKGRRGGRGGGGRIREETQCWNYTIRPKSSF